ncbi:branched-chain amino acid ABC transporter substrate-binding protein [Nocardioides panaciterrulae]|uniref:Branched-chain amino acid transport system substrate-binding protein n=1 Tax=Nocardioides panaciterrulae TaxID=661492 RepID=A0A7Y9E343_9ACTN|nr:branched-chain amino acid ABC transporter substrate-binding protein [Nocardioides panaciterrulae]NYD40229.1 branched-chain amino acid transport system substrate-binding protein [Nocardioides panaciterrulae]
MQSRKLLLAATLTLGALSLTACGQGLGSGSTADGSGPITIGMVVPLSGSSSAIGPYMQNGAQLAVNEINADGGIDGRDVKLEVADGACDPKTAVAAANKLVSSDIAASVGGYCSGATLPTLPVFAKQDIPMIIPAANSTQLVEQKLPNVFLINGTGAQQAQAAMKWFDKEGASAVSLVDDNTSYSVDIADKTAALLKESGGPDLAGRVSVTAGESDYSANVNAIITSHPDFVYWTGYYQEGGLIIRQLRQAGYQGPIMVGDGSVDGSLVQIAGEKQAQGVFATMTQTPDTLTNASGWIADYKKAFGADPGPFSTQSYDAVRVAAKAIEDAGSTDGKKMISALEALKDFHLFSGPLTFTPEHTLSSGGFVILKVKGTKFELEDDLS